MSDEDTKPPDVTPEQVQRLCQIISEFLPPKHGFIVFMCPTGDAPDRRMRYASNLKREQAVAGLKEWMIQRGFDENWMRHHD